MGKGGSILMGETTKRPLPHYPKDGVILDKLVTFSSYSSSVSDITFCPPNMATDEILAFNSQNNQNEIIRLLSQDVNLNQETKQGLQK